MSINVTTLSAAMGESDLALTVASATGITAPNFTTGAGVTYLQVENELMLVQAVNGTYISVTRGQSGTGSVAHASAAPVVAGLVTDFPQFTPLISSSFAVAPTEFAAIGAPLTGATIAPPGAGIFHFTGTTALVTITPVAGLVSGGKITLIFDGSASGLTWTAAGNISVAGTSTTAKSAVNFVYDVSTSKWIPDRLA